MSVRHALGRRAAPKRPTGPEPVTPTEDIDHEIAEAYSRALHAQRKLHALIKLACPGEHKFVQFRDGRKAWCVVCHYSIDGTRVHR